jgi:hypothetical protein
LSPTPARPTDEIRQQAFVTGYSWHDNTPPGSPTISRPVLHTHAGGTGTFVDPITVAVGHSIGNGRDIPDWPAGTRFYIPNLRRYVIVEDTCGDGASPQNGPCHIGYPAAASTWLDVWVDGRDATATATEACTNAITRTALVIRNPAPGRAVVPGPISRGDCTRQFGDIVT